MLPTVLTYLRARFGHDQEGASMVEYGLLVALVAIVALVTVGPMGDTLQQVFGRADADMTDALAP